MPPPPTSSPSSAGVLLAASIFAGAAIGIWRHQPSAGLIGGLAVGLAAVLVQWLLERWRG